eukprot:gnl/TRDRNA2_/TRDRNA2_170985_c0_seq3.p1 gnl/TRDRNA2_/TRDRNA2_170985_c0~~gnl/TRDRNA2_/TRDRNA2_170985_c0_seq3.p1  ORF type:complete len:212 (+),score=50.62 gnl/TRDRNA2_/TRDRNA2_170985_c0_seq3:707-1342(+)
MPPVLLGPRPAAATAAATKAAASQPSSGPAGGTTAAASSDDTGSILDSVWQGLSSSPTGLWADLSVGWERAYGVAKDVSAAVASEAVTAAEVVRSSEVAADAAKAAEVAVEGASALRKSIGKAAAVATEAIAGAVEDISDDELLRAVGRRRSNSATGVGRGASRRSRASGPRLASVREEDEEEAEAVEEEQASVHKQPAATLDAARIGTDV